MNNKICVNKKIVFLAVATFLVYAAIMLTNTVNKTTISFNSRAAVKKVVGGNFAQEGDYPFYMFIVTQQKYACGGSLIGSQWILTAKHCVQDDKDNIVLPDQVEVYANYTTYTKALDNKISGKYYYKVKEIIPYSEGTESIFYLKNTSSWFKSNLNDVVLLKLASSVDLPTISFPPNVCPAPASIDGVILGTGDIWSSIIYNKASPDLSLKYAKLILKPDKGDYYNSSKVLDSSINLRFLSSNYIDTFTSGARGDSGGPVIMALDNKKIEIGLVSTATRNAYFTKKTRTSDLRYYSSWITKKTEIKPYSGTWNGNLIPTPTAKP